MKPHIFRMQVDGKWMWAITVKTRNTGVWSLSQAMEQAVAFVKRLP